MAKVSSLFVEKVGSFVSVRVCFCVLVCLGVVLSLSVRDESREYRKFVGGIFESKNCCLVCFLFKGFYRSKRAVEGLEFVGK